MNKKQNVKRFLLYLIIFVIIIQSFGSFHVNASGETPSSLDLTLTIELAQAEYVYNDFMTKNMQGRSLDELQNRAREYIPMGAECTDVSVIGEVVYIDYQLEGIRYLVAYYNDGSVEKVARPVGGDDMFSINSTSNVVEQVNLEETLRTVEISDEEAVRRMNEMILGQADDSTVY